MFKYIVITLLVLVALTTAAKRFLRLGNGTLLAINALLFSLASLYPSLDQRLPPATLAALYILIAAAACLVFYFVLSYPSKVYDSPMALSNLEQYRQKPWKERLFSKKGAEEDMLEKNTPGEDFLAVLRYKMQCLPGPGIPSQEKGQEKAVPQGKLLPAGAPGQPGEQNNMMALGDTVESCLAAGFSARAQSDYARALSLFLKALGLGPAPNVALSLALEISSIYMAMGQYTQASMILSATVSRGLPGDTPLLQGLKERLAYIECLTALLAQAKLTNIPYFQVPEAIIQQAQKNKPQSDC